MDKKEKKQLEVSIKNILYFVEGKNEQDKMIAILDKYNAKMPDPKIKDWFDKIIRKSKRDYYEIVDFLIKDIFDGNITNERRKLIIEMLSELHPIVETAQRTIWGKFIDLFKWS